MFSLRTRIAVYAGLALAGLVLLLLVFRPSDPTDNPAYDALSKAHSRRMAADALALDSVRGALTAKSATVTQTVIKYHTIRDSLVITDTVKVKEFVAAADSTVRACTELVETCSMFRARAESSLADLRLDRDVWKGIAETRKPSRWEPVRQWAIRLGIGYVAFKVGQAAH